MDYRMYPFPFISYNPFDSQLIDPLDIENAYMHKEIPNSLHDAVARAKELVGDITIIELENLTETLEDFVLIGNTHLAKAFNPERTWCPLWQSDMLRAYLIYAEHDLPRHTIPFYLGAYALVMAGLAYNIVSPSEALKETCETDEYLAKTSSCDEEFRAMQDEKGVRAYGEEAQRAVLFAEGYQAALAIEDKGRRQKIDAGSKRHGKKTEITQDFISWSLELQPNHGHYRAIDIARHYIDKILENRRPELFSWGDYPRPEYLRDKLSKHCDENNIAHPVLSAVSQN